MIRVWIVNDKGEILITQRSLRKKGYPGMWEVPSGSAVAGDCSLAAAVREAAEETGITLLPENGELFSTYRCVNDIADMLYRGEFVTCQRQDFDAVDGILGKAELKWAEETKMKLLYGTSNPAKLASMRKILSPLGVEIVSLRDLNAPVPDVDENGASPCENARLKAAAYFKAFHRPVFSCDSGLYIDGLSDDEQPGVNVRTVGGKRLSDSEMTEHYAAIARKLGGRATARYRNAVCFVKDGGEVYESFADDLSGEKFYIVGKPHEKRCEGFPLDCLSVHIESGKYYEDMETNEFSEVWYDAFRQFFRDSFNMPADLSFVQRIASKRLYLRPFRETDGDALFDITSDAETVKFEPWPPDTKETAAQEAVRRSTDRDCWAICLNDDTLIGSLYFSKREFEAWETGYMLNRKYWRNGYAKEALTALMDFAFIQLQTRRVIAKCDPLNIASWRLLESVGFRREGELRQDVWFHKDADGNPIWKDTYEYGLLAQEREGLACQ